MSGSSGPNILGGYGAWADAIADRPGALSLLGAMAVDATSLEEWKRLGRARVRELLGPMPADAAPGRATGPGRVASGRAASGQVASGQVTPKVRTIRTSVFDGLEVEELAWTLPYGPETEAVFLKPAGARGPLPGVLALHDHGGLKRFGGRKIADTEAAVDPVIREHRDLYYGGTAWANELARRGFGVLSHDVFSFGSRRVRAADVPAHIVERLIADPAHVPGLSAESMAPGRESAAVDEDGRYEVFASPHEDVVARSLLALGLTFPGVTLAEDLAALAVLAERPEIDPRHLGCCGLSGGGLRACFLAGLSDSVACAVTAGFMSTWKDFALQNGYIHTWGLFVPHLSRSLDFPEILGLRAPLPSLVLACDGDLLFDPREVRKAESMLDAIYRRAGAEERMRTSHHPRPHGFDVAMQAEAFDWLGRRLSPGPL